MAAPARKVKNAGAWERGADDWYQEPRWCSERLFDVERPNVTDGVCDPFCGEGRILDAAKARGHPTVGVDRRIRKCSHTVFEDDGFLRMHVYAAGQVLVSNPPFKQAAEIAVQCHDLVLKGTIRRGLLLLPARFLWADRRAAWLERSVTRIWLLTPRPSMPPGRASEDERRGGTQDFMWVVFAPGRRGPPTIRWLRKNEYEQKS